MAWRTWKKKDAEATPVPKEKREPSHGSAQWYNDKVAPAVTALWSMIHETQTRVIMGSATKNEILQAMRPPADPDVAVYTQSGSIGRDGLALTCVNHGIDPETGLVDYTAGALLIDAIADGATDQEALAWAVLSGHTEIPAVMLQDTKFAEALSNARHTAQNPRQDSNLRQSD